MKSNLIRIAGALAVLVGIFLAFSCGDTSQNTDRSENVDVQTDGTPIPGADRACSYVDLIQRRDAVRARIERNIDNDNELKDMYRGKPTPGQPNPTTKKILNFWVQEYAVPNKPGFLVVYISGYGNKNDQMDDFVNTIESVMRENCVHKVVYLPRGATPPTAFPDGSNFEWDYCQYPQQACSNGACQDSCDLYPPVTNSNANANANQNQGANNNTGGNRNSNLSNNSNSNNRPG